MDSQINKIIFIEEPKVRVGYDQNHEDPRDGLMLFGPLTRDLKVAGNIGIIGPEISRLRMRNWLTQIHGPVFSNKVDISRPAFPGIEAVFGTEVNFNSLQEIDIEEKEINNFLLYTDSHQRIYNLVNLYSSKLIKYVDDHKPPVSVWFVVIPEGIWLYGKPKSRVPKSDGNITIGIKSKYSQNNPFLFAELNELQEAYKYELNFHNQLKAKLLKDRILTQIVRESTIAYKEINNKMGKPQRNLELFESAIAWNMGTTLYYKLGGTPWKLSLVRDKVCYLGIVYKRIENSTENTTACCAAQMFLDSGDGMVFKGNTGKWYNPTTREFHLDKDSARSLLNEVVEAYCADNNNQFPKEIFIHSKTYFDDVEWSGFAEVCPSGTKLVGVRIKPESSFKIYRDRTYPAPRGLTLILNASKAFLWTKGFIPKIKTVFGLETPNPLNVEIMRGESSIEQVCKDILSLTKLNYNSCVYGDGLPVTLRFANNVGEVITAGPMEGITRLSFRHYI